MRPAAEHIDTVLFDYGGVIAEEGFRNGLYAIAELNSCDEKTFYDLACRSIAGCGYLTGQGDEASFWTALRREHRLQQTDQQLRDEILRRFVLRPAMLTVVARLRRSGLRVGIISDQTNWLDELDRRDGFFTSFDIIFNSYHERASKYEGGLFPAVGAKLKTPPARILIVDDNSGNIAKALKLGFAAMVFENEEGFLRDISEFFPKIFDRAPS